MKCKICYNESTYIFSSILLNKHNVSYFFCPFCNFLQTEEPYWLEESYNEAINKSDTGIFERNFYYREKTAILIYHFFDKNKKFLEYAGGYGILTRLMRDIGFDFYWSDKYSKNLFGRGFEFNETHSNIELITTFESFEHFDEPIKEIETMLAISDSVFFSTELLPSPIPQPDNWWYYGLDHGQHISFYSIKTLNYLAQKYNLNLYTNKNNFHLLTKNDIKEKYFIKLLCSKNKLFEKIKHKMDSKTMNDYYYITEEILRK
ncbi:MAG: methyltransferase type 11 [Candidatus Margulisiibacteriota bacterium]|nr:MAG: hypothetical protein A2X41_12000 [Candidatus Margulisbacteria bacterium GWE2_39_32]PZM80101.1 MAG: methyltransferase type 11 [Candidatus Margulisiibacteriota bacterium]HCT84361.1 methyltransferase type 11 [Candidatus Margulisiibacteriota bacterium]HCY35781.1 methyltransferase type 11 [Candidatus Margulisiibacteriota bacterium]